MQKVMLTNIIQLGEANAKSYAYTYAITKQMPMQKGTPQHCNGGLYLHADSIRRTSPTVLSVK